jgi:hypothetical protein
VPRALFWTPRRVVKLRWYAERGLSQREAAKLLDTTYGAVINEASRLGIHFHGPPGAPRMNRNHKRGAWRKELQKLAAD